MLEQLAYLHGAPTARGILKAEAADFVVNEDLGFEPCGEGEHIFVRVRKTGENHRLGSGSAGRCGRGQPQCGDLGGPEGSPRGDRTVVWYSPAG